MVALTLTATVAQAQCTRGFGSNCLVTVAPVSPVVDGCGEHATPGRFKVILSSHRSVTYNQGRTGRYAKLFPPRTVDNVPVHDETLTRADFPTTLRIETASKHRSPVFTDWEWRSSGGSWISVENDGDLLWRAGQVGENIVEVRPKAGARIWSSAGELVVQTVNAPPAGGTTPYKSNHASGSDPVPTYFLFMGGKGCARVNHAGQTDGTIQ